MKTKYSKILYLLILIINFISCKAQQQYPLNTDYEEVPNYSYLKDLNHELDPYIGIYKANFNGKEITLYITKEEDKLIDYGDQKYYQDALIVKYVVKNSSGIVLQDTQNNSLSYNAISSFRIRSYDSSVIFSYEGTNCGVGWGSIFLKKTNATQFTWEYRPHDMIIMPGKCPGNPDLTIYLPVTKGLIFTKQ